MCADDDGHPVRFGSVGGGGRYDGLVARFRGEPVPATGFSIGVSRLLSALKAVGSPLAEAADQRGPVVVLVMDKGEIAHYQALVSRLRAAGIRSRTLSRPSRHECAAQICRPPRRRLCRDPGLERAQCPRRPASDDPRSRARRRSSPLRPRTARIIWNCASGRSFPWPRSFSSKR